MELNGLYQRYEIKDDGTGTYEPVYDIYGNEGIGLTGNKLDVFIKAILYGKDYCETDIIDSIQTEKGFLFYQEGIYTRLKNEKVVFKEKSGVFYKHETQGATSSSDKTKIRVITYELQ